MLLPYWILLIPYALGIGIFAIWMAFNVYHLAKFGFFDFAGKLHLFVFIALSMAIVGISGAMLTEFPWTDTFNIMEIPELFIPLPSSFTNTPII